MFAEMGMQKSFCLALILYVCISAPTFDWYSIAALGYFSIGGFMKVDPRMVIVVTIIIPLLSGCQER